jgi:hypothetical protein
MKRQGTNLTRIREAIPRSERTDPDARGESAPGGIELGNFFSGGGGARAGKSAGSTGAMRRAGPETRRRGGGGQPNHPCAWVRSACPDSGAGGWERTTDRASGNRRAQRASGCLACVGDGELVMVRVYGISV